MEKMNQYEAFKILRESGLLLERKLRSEMTPEELADARAKSKARRLARKARSANTEDALKEFEDKKNHLPIGMSKSFLEQANALLDEYKDSPLKGNPEFEKTVSYIQSQINRAKERIAKRADRNAEKKAANDRGPSNKGEWAVFTFSPIPEYIFRHEPEGWSDDVLEKIFRGHGVLVGYYPSKAVAEKIAMTIFEKEMEYLYKNAKKNDSSYGLEYNTHTLLVVRVNDDNRRWSSGRRGPGDSGYWYDAEKDVSAKQSKIKQETLERFWKEQKEEEERRERAERWANSSWNPDSGRFRNVYAHH